MHALKSAIDYRVSYNPVSMFLKWLAQSDCAPEQFLK